jgi:hypothetical protein
MTLSLISGTKLKSILGTVLIGHIALSPMLALANNGDIQLKPMQDTTVYSSNSPYSSTYGNYNLNNSSYNSTNDPYTTPYNATTVSSSSPATIYGRVSAIPKGTVLTVTLESPISSLTARMGDSVNGMVENDIYINDAVAVPAGSKVQGQIVSVSPSGHVGRHGVLDVRFSSIKLPGGQAIPINAHVVTEDKSGVLKGDTFLVDMAKGVGIAASGAGVGTLMGTAAGSLLGSVGTGAVFGLGVGALGGMGYALARKGKEVILPSGSRFGVVVDSATAVSN